MGEMLIDVVINSCDKNVYKFQSSTGEFGILIALSNDELL